MKTYFEIKDGLLFAAIVDENDPLTPKRVSNFFKTFSNEFTVLSVDARCSALMHGWWQGQYFREGQKDPSKLNAAETHKYDAKCLQHMVAVPSI